MTKHIWPAAAAAAVAALAVAGCNPLSSASSGGSTPSSSPATVTVTASAPPPTSPAPATSSAAPAADVTVCYSPVIPCNASIMKSEPTTLLLSGDGSIFASGVTWSGWGAATAQGTGTLRVNDCTPNCAAGKLSSYSATITVTGLKPFGGGQAYSSMTVSAPSDSFNETYDHNLVP